jgi:plastocyanin
VWAQHAPVTAQVEIVEGGAKPASTAHGAADASNVAVWLVPLDDAAKRAAQAARARAIPKMVQKNKSFQPHVLVVQVGSQIQFPNEDPFFHNVFSLFNGKRFDLGLYEAGSSKTLTFDRPGISFLFCNIHPEMSAVVVAVESPYYALSDKTGHVAIPGVPDGRYQVQVWYERGVADNLNSLTRTVVINESSRSLGRIQVAANPEFTIAHKNKYGQDYVSPASGSTGYPRP